jgi:acetyltransferase-like isoleucine patch superfamily enzyme
MKSLIKRIWQKIYRIYAVRKNVEGCKNIHIGLGSILWAPSKLTVGDHVYIGKNCTIEVDGAIGNDVVIANQVGIIGRWDHDYTVVGKSIRNAPWIGDPDYRGAGKGKQVVVEDDVWIGYGAILFSGVRVGRGAIVGAGAVVTEDVRPYDIVVGVPARPVGRRFTEEAIQEHELRLYGISRNHA